MLGVQQDTQMNEMNGGCMDITAWLLLAVFFVVGLVALIGFFYTKTKGFGRFATSTFLSVLVVVVSALLYAAGKLKGEVLANIFFAVIGFAGGRKAVVAAGAVRLCTWPISHFWLY